MNKQLMGAICLAAFFFSACNHGKKTPAKSSAPVAYEALTLGPHSTTIYNDFPATIEGIEIVQLRPMVVGYLEKVYAPEGANVTKGELLFKIKNPVYDEAVVTAKAGVQSAQANVDAAKMNVEKVRPLVEKDIVRNTNWSPRNIRFSHRRRRWTRPMLPYTMRKPM